MRICSGELKHHRTNSIHDLTPVFLFCTCIIWWAFWSALLLQNYSWMLNARCYTSMLISVTPTITRITALHHVFIKLKTLGTTICGQLNKKKKKRKLYSKILCISLLKFEFMYCMCLCSAHLMLAFNCTGIWIQNYVYSWAYTCTVHLIGAAN